MAHGSIVTLRERKATSSSRMFLGLRGRPINAYFRVPLYLTREEGASIATRSATREGRQVRDRRAQDEGYLARSEIGPVTAECRWPTRCAE